MRLTTSFGRLPPAERIEAIILAERLGEHAVEPEFAWIADLLDADRHALVTGCRLGSVGSGRAFACSRKAVVHHGRLDEGVELLQKPITQTHLAARIRHLFDQAAGRS
jgi:hypothetical protein